MGGWVAEDFLDADQGGGVVGWSVIQGTFWVEVAGRLVVEDDSLNRSLRFCTDDSHSCRIE